jgi:zinc/manganese transport system permease protein
VNDFLTLMFWPFLACLVLAGIHAYLGLHVIERQVIFVDLALAQIAAVGASLALVLGHELDGPHAYWLSLLFTVTGALIFSFTRFRYQRVPQEAIIGIVYAVSAAILLLVLSGSGEGDEHIRQALTGNILLVRPDEVLKIALIYAVIGAFHVAFRSKFMLITTNPEEARTKLNVRFWDFLFYASFGVVVTSSVKIAGVLLVFSYLVVPAACAVLFAKGVGPRLVIGWVVGFFASAVGIAASYEFDLPTGASVVCVFGAALVFLAVVRRLLSEI